MKRPALVLRPEPGNMATAIRLEAAGLQRIRLPLFAVIPLPWDLPAGTYDALLLTSANAIRHAGPGLAALQSLPVIAVGSGTAAAAQTAGLDVAAVGGGDASEALALAHARGWRRVLRLAGRERTTLHGITDVPVYASEPIERPPGALQAAEGSVALLHSQRAARRFVSLVERDDVCRADVRLAAISPAVADAAGPGWARVGVASEPSDVALIELAGMLAIDP